jgi:hypothetical protein
MPLKLPTLAITAAIVVAALGAGAYWWYGRKPPMPMVAPAPVLQPVVPPAAPSAPAASEPGAARHPIDAGDAEPAEASAATLKDALAALLGPENLLRFVLPENFVQQTVATVDALGREHAAPRLWPVVPTPGRFQTDERAGSLWLAADNARRYDPFVRFAAGIDTQRAAALYKRLYPQFQSAYEALGFPGRHFNDRLVEVIDLLLATPEPPGPLPLVLTEVKGPVPSVRPWTRHEFADPSLEARPAGQKMLLRVGPEHARALKAQLRAFRAEIARP